MSGTNFSERNLEQNPWSRVFGVACGRFTSLCLLLYLILLFAMIVYTSMYASLVSNHPNILCVPTLFLNWWIKMTFGLLLCFLTILCIIRFGFGKKGASPIFCVESCTTLTIGIFCCFLYALISPLFGIEGVIVGGAIITTFYFNILVLSLLQKPSRFFSNLMTLIIFTLTGLVVLHRFLFFVLFLIQYEAPPIIRVSSGAGRTM